MTATDELRRLLDERGEEHYDGTETTLWLKDGVGYRASADEGLNGFIHLHLWCTNPAQAVEATLGRGTCHDACNSVAEFTCSQCGFSCDLTSWVSLFDGDEGRHRHHHHGTPNFCPNCGRRCVG